MRLRVRLRLSGRACVRVGVRVRERLRVRMHVHMRVRVRNRAYMDLRLVVKLSLNFFICFPRDPFMYFRLKGLDIYSLINVTCKYSLDDISTSVKSQNIGISVISS